MRKPKKYRLEAALALVALHGYTHVSLPMDARAENRMVTIHSDWTPKGKEFAEFRLALGKYRGNELGRAYRDNPLADLVPFTGVEK